VKLRDVRRLGAESDAKDRQQDADWAQVLDQQWVRRGISVAIANIVGLTKGLASGLERELEGFPFEPSLLKPLLCSRTNYRTAPKKG
jgi:hypothetical protein